MPTYVRPLQRRSRTRVFAAGLCDPWRSRSSPSYSSTARAALALEAPVVEAPAKRNRAASGSPVDKEDHQKSSSGRPWTQQALPIQAVLQDAVDTIQQGQDLVLHAPTGAGKTTILPLAVLETGFVEGRILVLQPRRLTCINVARRMAELWGDRLGETVGYRIRHESLVSTATRIEVITEGILVRMLLSNPRLEGIGCIFFDEFHERSSDSDLSLTLSLTTKQRFQLGISFVVMSATFQGLAERVVKLLGPAVRTITSTGRTFPVEVRHEGLLDLHDFEPKGPMVFAKLVAGRVRDVLEEHRKGDVLVFLPGEREIMYTWIALNNMAIGNGKAPRNLVPWARRLIDKSVDLRDSRVDVSPLYGSLDAHEQDDVLQTTEAGRRKVILATPVAESSLTVPGVRVVVDTGLRKVKREDPMTSVSSMVTVPVSQASADQRAGRAGRLSKGTCYRLWDERQHQQLMASDEPEIHRSELGGLVLDLANFGALSNEEIRELPWVDAPKAADLNLARLLLWRMEALERLHGGGWALTERGRLLSRFPVHPRIAHMIQQASAVSDSLTRDACDLAALLEERELLRGGRTIHGADLEVRLRALRDPSTAPGQILEAVRERVHRASEQMHKIAKLGRTEPFREQSSEDRRCFSILVAWAFPELLARRNPGQNGMGKAVSYRLSAGGDVRVDSKDGLSHSGLLAPAAVTGVKLFWALRATKEDLAAYGMDARHPTEHKVLLRSAVDKREAVEGDEEEGAEEEWAPAPQVRLVPIQRYFLGMDCNKVTSVEDVLSLLTGQSETFPADKLTSILWDLAREESVQEGLISRLAEEVVVPRLEEFSSAQMVEVACALAVSKAGRSSLAAIAAAVTPRLEELPLDSEDGNLSALLWAVTVQQVGDAELFQGLAARATQALVDFKPCVLSDVREVCFWSFHRSSASSWAHRGSNQSNQNNHREVGFACPKFYEVFAALVKERLEDIHPISCVYLFWSFAKARARDDELFAAISARVGPVVSSLDRCGVTMFGWSAAYSEMDGEDGDEILQLVLQDVLRPERMAEMAPRDVAGVAWAFTKAGVSQESLLPELLAHSRGLLLDAIKQQCFRRPAKSLFREIYIGDESAVEAAVDAFSMDTLGDLLCACAEQQHVDQEFLSLCKEYMVLGLKQQDVAAAERFARDPGRLARALEALSRLTPDFQEILEAASPYVQRQSEHISLRNLITLLKVWAISGCQDPWMVAAMDRSLGCISGDLGFISEEQREDLDWAATELGLAKSW